MPVGTIVNLVHLSQQTYQPTSRLIPSHNDKGYGTIRSEGDREIYFAHDAVPGRHGFDDLRRGQSVEFTLEIGSQFIANSVNATTTAADGHNPTVRTADKGGMRFRHIVRTYRRPFQPPCCAHHPLDGYPRGY
jgi:cold shock CspA family protein